MPKLDVLLAARIVLAVQKRDDLENSRLPIRSDEEEIARIISTDFPPSGSDSDSNDEDEEFETEYEKVYNEQRRLSLFTKESQPQRTLKDFIFTDNGIIHGIDQNVVEMYTGVGEFLSTYTRGRVPEVLRAVMNSEKWEELLYLTQPEKWSPEAMFQATIMFVSKGNSRMAARFCRLVLLPAVRQDMAQNQTIHTKLLRAVRTALVNMPCAFFKGILLPICKSGSCTLLEAAILSTVIKKASIPAADLSVAIAKIAKVDYSGLNSLFLKRLLDKTNALPLSVINAVVKHFIEFANEERELPSQWHQSLLSFVQRCKNSLTQTDKENLMQIMQRHNHLLITPNVLRELTSNQII